MGAFEWLIFKQFTMLPRPRQNHKQVWKGPNRKGQRIWRLSLDVLSFLSNFCNFVRFTIHKYGTFFLCINGKSIDGVHGIQTNNHKMVWGRRIHWAMEIPACFSPFCNNHKISAISGDGPIDTYVAGSRSAVWPDWAIFESSLQQILLQK